MNDVHTILYPEQLEQGGPFMTSPTAREEIHLEVLYYSHFFESRLVASLV